MAIPAPLASIIPLDYGGHDEHSVLFIDPVWNNLVDLLARPQTHLLNAGGAPFHSPKAWKLRSPAVALIRPLSERFDLAHQIVGSLQGAVPTYNPAAPDPMQWPKDLMNLWEHELAAGLFVCEFALDTAFLTISYLPPLNPGPLRFQAGFTATTIGLLKTPVAYSNATLHTDLLHGQGHTRLQERAQFVVDMIESRQPYAQQVMGNPGFVFDYSLVQANLQILPQPPLQLPHNHFPRLTFEPVIPQGPQAATVRRCDFGTHIVEGLREDIQPETCVVTQTYAKTATLDALNQATDVTYALDWTAYKVYSQLGKTG